MNKEFIDLLTRNLIEKKDYIPLRDENKEIPEYRNGRILERLSYGSHSILEVLDGDEFSKEEIEARLSRNSDALLNIEGDSCFFFEVIVFKTSPEEEKLEVIRNGQYQKYPGKKFLGCITVDLSEKTVEKYYKFPTSSGGVEKVISATLSENLQESEVEINLEELVQKKEREAAINFVVRKPYVSYILIGINIAVWLAITLYAVQANTEYGMLLGRFGAKNNLDILSLPCSTASSFFLN